MMYIDGAVCNFSLPEPKWSQLNQDCCTPTGDPAVHWYKPNGKNRFSCSGLVWGIMNFEPKREVFWTMMFYYF